jgi:hypothetical protein
MSNGARHPFRDLFGDAAAGPMLTDADLQHIERRAERLAKYGRQPPGAQADIAQIRGRAAGQAELAADINDALRARDVVRAQAMIHEGAALYGHAAMMRAVEAQASADHMEAMEAVRRREADLGEQADVYYESDYRTAYDEAEDF